MKDGSRRTFCRFCHANCAMVADIEGDRVIAVRGDPIDPVFGGYTCIKGRQLADAHNSPHRLTQSLARRGDGFEAISSRQALDEIADKLRAVIDRYGPDGVGVFAGTYAFQNSAGLGSALAFAKGVGTRHFYTSITLDQPAKVYTTMRYGHWEGGMHSFSTADVAFFIGNNPIVSHYGPPGGLPPFSPSRRLRDAINGGLKLIVADPRASDVAKLANIHLPVRPGEDPALLAGMIRVILKEGLYDRNFTGAHVDGLNELSQAVEPFTLEMASARCGVEASQITAAARMFANAARGVASTGTGPEMAGRGTLTAYLVHALNVICGRFCQEGELAAIPGIFTAARPRRAQVAAPVTPWGEGFPKSRFRGLTQLGFEMPCNVLADEILEPGEGQIRALIVIGGNPVVAFPDQDKIARALDDLDLLVCVDAHVAQTSKRADYIIAPKMCLERDDISNLSEWWYEEPYARYARALVPAPGDVLDEYEVMWELAHRLGSPMPLAGGPCPMDVCPDKAAFLDLMTAGCLVKPSKVRADTPDCEAIIYHDVHPIVQPADPDSASRFNLTAGSMPEALSAYAGENSRDGGYRFRLVSRRTRHRFNSTGDHLPALKAKAATNPLHVHPDDLKALALSEGAIARIASPVGHVFAVVKANEEMRPGIVSMAHGWGDVDGGPDDVRDKGGSTNRLVKETIGYDPITGQSLQSAIPVNISAA